MRKRLIRAATLSVTLLLAATTSLTVGAGVAGAATTADPNCTGHGADNLVDPVGPYYSAAYIKNRTTGTVVGTVQLCERLDADRDVWVRWAAVTLYYDMSSGQKANGRVHNNVPNTLDYQERLCSHPGGTGAIIGGTGDRTCATAGLDDLGYLASADAYVYGADGTMLAYGSTDKY